MVRLWVGFGLWVLVYISIYNTNGLSFYSPFVLCFCICICDGLPNLSSFVCMLSCVYN